jgi:hypothetical protein
LIKKIILFNFLQFSRDLQKILEKSTRIKNQYIKEFIAELFGTLIMLLFGLGSVAQLKFLMIENPFTTSLISVNLSFGFGVVAAILVTGKASGHENFYIY